MRLHTRFLRERTRPSVTGVVTFNAPGVYKPPYGSRIFELEGRGTPGNPPTPGNYAGTNPGSGGTYAGTNPGYGGTYAGTNPTTPGNVSGYNPATPGNIGGYNPPTGGNYAGANPPVPGNITHVNWEMTIGTWPTGQYGSSPSCPTGYVDYYTGLYVGYSCSPVRNPATPGNAYYNPTVPGNANYNPTVPGNARYNPAVPGNAYYNPYYPGNAYYNPYYPGYAYYNPTVPGNAGTPRTVLGVTLPGGARGSAAPVIGYVPVVIDYTTQGVSITVPPGGYVRIKNS